MTIWNIQRIHRFWIGSRKGLVLAVILVLVATMLPAAGRTLAIAASTQAPTGPVEVPEHPEGTAFNPNQLKNIQAADPGSKVNLISPPTVNNTGDARVSYPLEVPPGRAGMQPSLAVSYNSSAANSWVGVGWDLPMQAITIDTRWGVPRYEGGLETETYLLNGEQLTPVAHRGLLQARTSEKIFHTRVEGRFAKIVRHGDNPANYSWEVTDKAGMRSVFGGTESSTLTDEFGNIAVWSLREMRDTNNNVMRYECVRVFDVGVDGGSVPGSNLYLKRITYTGHGDTAGPYAVTFFRDRDLGEPRRADVMIDARNGFKKVTADLLRKVEVSLNGGLVRRYELDYRTGAFAKTLLRSISQFGANGQRFTTHEFDYYDDIRDQAGEYQAFAIASGWTLPADGLGAPVPDGSASALSANTSRGVGGHLYVGFNPVRVSKSGSAGAKIGFNSGSAEGLLALTDVNGDSLPDKVFRTGAGVFYRPNLSGPRGQTRFGDVPIPLPGLPGILAESSRSGTTGVESYFGVAAQLNRVTTTTRTDRYLTDVNADGIADLVSNGSVLFGRLDADGNPSYTANSAQTPVPIGPGSVSGTIVGDQTAEFERQVDTFPLHDGVRRWVAPFDGTVAVSGGVRLVQDTSPQRAAHRAADGVRVTIQHENTELWAQRIGPDDYGTSNPTGVDTITVRRGDRLYFRVQSVLDGLFDTVAWDPNITYTSLAPSTDVNGLDNHRYCASRDFTLGGRPSLVIAPIAGTLHLSGDVSKTGSTTDDVTVVISRNGTDVLTGTLPAGGGGTVPVNLDIPVAANDVLSFRLRVDSPIDLGTVHWVPSAHYTATELDIPVVDGNGNPTMRISPPFDVDMYPATALTAPQGFHTAPASGDVTVQPNLAFGDSTANATVVFTVKKRGALLAKRAIAVTNGQVPAIDPVTVTVSAGDDLFFDFSTLDTALLGQLATQSVTVDGAAVPSSFNASAEQGAFAQPYRGWAAIGYQGNRDRATTPIIQTDLVVDQNYRNQIPGAPTEDDVPGFDGRVSTPKAIVFAPQPALGRWGSSDENTFVSADTAASSRLGADTIDVARDSDFAGATGVSRVGRTTQTSATFGAQIPGIPIGVGASVARGDGRGEVDFIDLNGDRFPDAVGSAGIQYSDMIGGLGNTRGSLGTGNIRESDTTAFTVSANAGSPARSTSNGRGMSAPPADTSANTARSGSEMPALGVGGSLGGGESNAEFDLLDINGDGLPDRVFDNGFAALNLGYRFASAEPWPGGPVNDGDTSNVGVNLGFNTDFYGFAGGASASLGSSKTDASLQDMNGDGLLDRVFANGTVAINKGNGFTAAVPFRGGLSGINRDANSSLGAGAYFTFGFCLGIFAGGCVVFNPGADASTGIGRVEVALRDINGDGYVDHVRSTRDDELVVAENRTGRTNLLRTVHRPLGARFDLDYTRDGNTTEMPDSRFVLSRTTVFDGHAGDGQDTQLSTIRYENGRHDRLEREFYGYARVVVEQRDPGAGGAVYRTQTAEYRTDSFYTRGLTARTLTADGAGRPFQEQISTYQLRDVATGAAADPNSTTATVFPALSRVDDRFYEGQPAAGKTTFSQIEYDEFGNVTREFDAAEVGTGDDVERRIRYTATDPACRSRNIVGIGNFTQTLAVATGAVMRHSESTVDCVTGNTTQVRALLASGPAAVTDLEYLGDGNLRSVTGPANSVNQRYRLEYGYDTVVGAHIESIVDSFGYRSSATHDLRFGLPTTQTDQNNQQIRTVYDSVGRVDTVTGPYEIAENRVTIDFEYHPEAPVPFAVTRHVDRTATGVRDDAIDTVQFVDGLGRPVQTKKDASVAAEPGAAPQPVMVVSGRVRFDFLGRAVEGFYPVTEAKGAGNTTFNPAFDTVRSTRTSLDVLDRTTRTELPDTTVTTTAYGFGPDRSGANQFETIATDANGKQKRIFTDVRGLTTSVKEFNPAGGQPVIWTSYGYDPLRQITSVVDDRGNTTRSEYDNFGRRTIVDSPDAGRTETRFDLAGNATAKMTAKLRTTNQAVEYDYEFNRLSRIRYPVFPGNNVTYTYGAPGAADNAADRITEVRDAAGTVTRGYGPLGETVRETRTVTAINGPARTYTTRHRFDAWNRVLQLTYPDTEVLTYEYDTGGQVNRATGRKGAFDYTYLARLDYDKFGQRVLQDTGNGVRTTYAYNAADRRLATLNSRLPDGFAFQNISYRYDNVGNVTELFNNVPLPHGKPIGGPSRQTYGYDDLYRLTTAGGQYRNKENKEDRYTFGLAYDTIHNVTAKNQRHEIDVNPGDPFPPPPPPLDPTDPTPPLGPIEQPDETVPTELEPEPQPAPAPAPGSGTLAVGPVPLGTTASAGAPSAGTASAQEQRRTTYDYAYDYNSGKPHAPGVIGPVVHAYDANGNLVDAVNTLPPAPGKRRQLIWDEDNRLACNQDHNRNTTLPQDPSACGTPQQPATVRYVYDDQGNRVVKDAGPQHIYPNRGFSERNGTGFKHIFVGETRLATKTVKTDSTFENHQFFFHSDHLGSSSYVTDEHANLTEHMEYFAFGETWVNEHPAQPTPVAYGYNGKELDEETGLYYYGARYYNPRTQLWQSPDPALQSYLDGHGNGGVYNPTHLASYTYTLNNPVRLIDPDGRFEAPSPGTLRVIGRVAVGAGQIAVRACMFGPWGCVAGAVGLALVVGGAYLYYQHNQQSDASTAEAQRAPERRRQPVPDPAPQPQPVPRRGPDVRTDDDDGGERIAVIGRTWDLEPYKRDPQRYEVLDIPDMRRFSPSDPLYDPVNSGWTISVNQQFWLRSVIRRRMLILVASPETGNRWDYENNRPTVFGLELDETRESGYQPRSGVRPLRQGEILRPPGRW